MTRQEHLQALMTDHQADVWRFLRMLGCDRALADDLTQEVFLYVLDHPFADLGRAAAAGYLRRAARHMYLNWLRANKRVVPLEIEPESEAVWARTTGDSSDDRLDALRRCLDRLAPRQRQALDLKYAQSRSEAELAQDMQTSVDAIKGLLKRTREQLRQCVQGQVKP